MRSLPTAGLIAGLAAAIPLAALADAPEAPGADAAEAPAEAPAGPEAEAADYDASTVLARVNGTEITLGHVVTLRERLPEQFLALPDETLLEGLIDQLIDQELLARTVSEAPEDDPLAVRLHLENERRGSLAQQVVRARIAAGIEDEAVQEAYDAAFAGFEGQTEFRASHILVETEEEAQEIRDEIEGGGDFAEIARERSQDPGSGARGGDLGWFGLGRMVEPFEEAVTALEPGEIGGPVETQFGWHVIRLEETRVTEPPSLEEVRPELENQIRQQRLAAELDALREAAEIERPQTGIPAAAIRDSAILEE